MENGRTIRVYLADGSVTGIRHAEIINWTGQAVSCPRNHINTLLEWPESTRPGVYFLFGIDEDSGQQAVYIGEAENVFERIRQHLSGKDFWQEVILFTNKDENLTKAHIKYLESGLVKQAIEAGRYAVKNANIPPSSNLPRGDRAAMEEFLRNQRVLLGVMGHRLLEPLTNSHPTMSTEQQVAQNSDSTFHIKAKGITATAQRTDEGMVVLAGSQAVEKTQASLPNVINILRDTLVEKSILTLKNNHLIFEKDYLFSSPSQAAAFILGRSASGPQSWFNQHGQSLKELEERTLKNLDSN